MMLAGETVKNGVKSMCDEPLSPIVFEVKLGDEIGHGGVRYRRCLNSLGHTFVLGYSTGMEVP